MDTSELRAFCTAAEAGSLSEAARRLRLSQPGLSRQVKRLEQEIGVQLLRRRGRGIQLTPAGERFLQFATRTLADYERLLEATRNARPSLRGRLTIVASTTPGEYLVPQLVARFADAHPAVTAEVAVTDSAAVPPVLLERRADVGFTGHRAASRRLTHLPVGRDEVVLAVPSAHRLATETAVSVDALAGERLIQREAGSGTQLTFLEALEAAGLTLPVEFAPVSLGSTQAVLSAVEAGMGIGVVTLRAIEHHRPALATAVRVRGVTVVRDLFLVYEEARNRPPHVQAFIDYVAEQARG